MCVVLCLVFFFFSLTLKSQVYTLAERHFLTVRELPQERAERRCVSHCAAQTLWFQSFLLNAHEWFLRLETACHAGRVGSGHDLSGWLKPMGLLAYVKSCRWSSESLCLGYWTAFEKLESLFPIYFYNSVSHCSWYLCVQTLLINIKLERPQRFACCILYESFIKSWARRNSSQSICLALYFF